MNIMTSPFHYTWACMRLGQDIWVSQIKVAQVLMAAPLAMVAPSAREMVDRAGRATPEPMPAARFRASARLAPKARPTGSISPVNRPLVTRH